MSVPLDDLSDEQIERYARHLVLPEVDEDGQLKLLNSRVLVIGAGGLGSPLLLYLAAAGVGTLGVVDDDVVDLSNLQRQVLHGEENLGQDKVESARANLARINPEVTLEAHSVRLTPDNALDIIRKYDLVADGSDNFATRYLVNDACHLAGKTLVSAAIMRFDGQLSTYRSHLSASAEPEAGSASDGETASTPKNPCYRCLFGEQPDADPKQSCADVGVMGALAGVMGSLQSVEVIKELLGIGQSMSGRLLLYDALEANFRTVKFKADPDCPLCGSDPSIKDLDPGRYKLEGAVCAAQ
ncbi:HesA/MoeB/ThiF family protein [Rhodovibrionaceae bacterium A322]